MQKRRLGKPHLPAGCSSSSQRDPNREDRFPHPTDCSGLQDLKWMSSCGAILSKCEAVRRIDIDSTMEQLIIQEDHVTSLAPVVKQWQLQQFQSLFVGHMSDASHHACSPALHPFKKPLAGPVERSPNNVAKLKMQAYQRLVKQRESNSFSKAKERRMTERICVTLTATVEACNRVFNSWQI